MVRLGVVTYITALAVDGLALGIAIAKESTGLTILASVCIGFVLGMASANMLRATTNGIHPGLG